jgi:hypothetical protein
VSLHPLRSALATWSPSVNEHLEPFMAVTAAWPDVAGAQVAEHARPARLMRDTLIVVTRSNAWSQQLSLLAGDLLRGLHERPELHFIAQLRFRVGTVRPARRPRAAPAASRGRRSVSSRPPSDPEATAHDVVARLREAIDAQRSGVHCPECGARRDEPGLCAPCGGFAGSRRRDAAQRLMYDAPWLGYAGIGGLVPGLGRDEYERWRRSLLARWWETLSRVRWTKRVTHFERRILSSYVLLQSEIEPDRVTPAIVRNVLGDDLAAIFDVPVQR